MLGLYKHINSTVRRSNERTKFLCTTVQLHRTWERETMSCVCSEDFNNSERLREIIYSTPILKTRGETLPCNYTYIIETETKQGGGGGEGAGAGVKCTTAKKGGGEPGVDSCGCSNSFECKQYSKDARARNRSCSAPQSTGGEIG